MSPRNCPTCGAECAPGDRFCTGCGDSLATGAVGRPAPPREEESAGIAGPLLWFLDLFPGLLRPIVIIMSIVVIALSLFVGYMALVIFSYMVISAFLIGGFAVVMYWAGLSWMLYGYIAAPAEALSEFRGKHWMAFMIMTFVPVGVLFWFAKAVGTL